jgi:hypothetical protein
MKKLFALLLITVFVSSSLVKLYKDFTNDCSVSFSLYDTEDDNEEKEIEKDNDLKKDKIIIDFLISSPLGLSETQKFYITHLYFLPTPYIAEDIIPPNKA